MNGTPGAPAWRVVRLRWIGACIGAIVGLAGGPALGQGPAPTVCKLYWIDMDAGLLQRADPDGSAIETLLTMSTNDTAGFAIDAGSCLVYFTNTNDGTITRTELDGSNPTVLVSGLGFPPAVALDLDAGRMYWTDRFNNKVQRANLDGSMVEDVVVGTGSLQGIAVDSGGGKVYWADSDNDLIRRANLDGSGAEDVVTGVQIPFDLALDPVASHVYFTDRLINTIERADLDGQNRVTLISGGVLQPRGIALDVAAGKMYFADEATATIKRADLDGTNVADVVTTGIVNARAVAILPATDVSWAAPISGSWDVATNWRCCPPTTASRVQISVPGTYTVAGPSLPTTVAGLFVGAAPGTATFDLLSGFSVTAAVTVIGGGRLELNGLTLSAGSAVTTAGGEVAGPGSINASINNNGTIVGALQNPLTLAGPFMTNGPAGVVRAPIAATVLIDSAAVSQSGVIEAEPFGRVDVAEPLINAAGGQLSLVGGTIAAPSIANDPGAFITGTGTVEGVVNNSGGLYAMADLTVTGPLTNTATGVIVVQTGTLTVGGTLTSDGEVRIADTSPLPAGLRRRQAASGIGRAVTVAGATIAGDGQLTSASILTMTAGTLTVGGDFDASLNEAARFDLAGATLQMTTNGFGAQALEVMSTDIGNDPRGLSRACAGHFPIGTLHVGPDATTVDLVDAHDNDRLGASPNEALYVDTLVLDSAVSLNTNTIKVYYRSFTPSGAVVDVPANLVQIDPLLIGDSDGDGDVDLVDYAAMSSCLTGPGGGPLPSPCNIFDNDCDDDVDLVDYAAFQRFFGGG